MLLRTVIALLIVSSLLGCSKESIVKPYSFLNLRVEGQEEDIKWETITGSWTDTLGTANIEATSYYFDRCTIKLKSITSTGTINPLTLMQFYYQMILISNLILFLVH